MDGGIDAVARQQLLQRAAITRVALDQQRPAAGNLFDAVHHLRRTVAEVVENDHVMPGAQQFHHGVGTDVTGTAGDQECLFVHEIPCPGKAGVEQKGGERPSRRAMPALHCNIPGGSLADGAFSHRGRRAAPSFPVREKLWHALLHWVQPLPMSAISDSNSRRRLLLRRKAPRITEEVI